MPDQDTILLQTKLNRPRLPAGFLERTSLLDLLNKNIENPLILVCAPAGFGKSTLIGSWLEKVEINRGKTGPSMPSAWVSLDENDSDLYLFLRYFLAAVRKVYKNACANTLGLLHARQQTPENVLYITLSNDLEELQGELLLVLDDYHNIHGTEVHNLLTELIRHWPKYLHLVLISRISPPIPLSSLRAKGMLCEIRTRDLRFTPEETAKYLDPTDSNPIMQNNLPLLQERFEGWPAGLHLATLSLRSVNNQDSIFSALSNENTNITSYLVDEVLKQQSPAIQTFLLKTSILDRFSISLCEAVIPEIDPSLDLNACLDWVEQAELFLIPLDNRREWYRYHQFFQDLLQRRLSVELTADMVIDLHRRASSWFESHGLIDEALQHASAAGDLDLVSHQMYDGIREVMNREDRLTLERWQRLLTDEMILRHPELLMLKIWVLQFSWRLNLQAQVIEQLEKLLDSADRVPMAAHDLQILRGQILALNAQQAYLNNHAERGIELCQQVLHLLPPSWTFVRGAAMLYLGMSMQAIGQGMDAERFLLDEYEGYENKNDVYALFLLQSLCFIYLKTGQLSKVNQTAQVLVQGTASGGMRLMKYWGDWFLGVVNYHRNELEASAQHFTEIVENRFIAQIAAFRDAVAGLAMIHQTRGETSEAWQMLEKISQFDLIQSGSEDNRTRSLRARVMSLQGDLEGASQWVDNLIGLPPDQTLMWLEEPQLTRVRILLARRKGNDIELALQVLDSLYEITNRTHNTYHKIEVMALRSLSLERLGDARQAEDSLAQALVIARPGGFIRVFLDLGKPMRVLLERMQKQDPSDDFLNKIIGSFEPKDKHFTNIQNPNGDVETIYKEPQIIIEPLTPRELEVLGLLFGPMSIKEIAHTLNISYATVKRHSINIYAKLGVNNRRNAVARAEELNILPSRRAS